MTPNQLHTVTSIAAVGSGAMGGLLFAFSSTVMPALGSIPDGSGIRAMQEINRRILNPFFGLLFFGTAASSIGLVVNQVKSPDTPRRGAAGAVVYLVGFLLVTVAIHVPLNSGLDRLNPDTVDSASAWRRFLGRWVAFNHLRAAATIVACALLTTSL
jgi:uncharacterized membrane protein